MIASLMKPLPLINNNNQLTLWSTNPHLQNLNNLLIIKSLSNQLLNTFLMKLVANKSYFIVQLYQVSAQAQKEILVKLKQFLNLNVLFNNLRKHYRLFLIKKKIKKYPLVCQISSRNISRKIIRHGCQHRESSCLKMINIMKRLSTLTLAQMIQTKLVKKNLKI